MIKGIVAATTHEGGKPRTMKSFNETLQNDRYVIGTITGQCANSKCRYKHTLLTPNITATKLVNMLKQGTTVLVKD